MGGSLLNKHIGKHLRPWVDGRYLEVAAIQRWPLLEVRLYYEICDFQHCLKIYIKGAIVYVNKSIADFCVI